MRACHVVRQYAPAVGGLETFVAKLIAALRELGCAGDVLTLNEQFRVKRRLAPVQVIDGVRVRRVPKIGHPRFFMPLIDDRRLDGYDVIHVHGVDGMFDRMAMRRRAPGQALVATSHGLFFHTPWMAPLKEVYLWTVTRHAASRYDVLIANSASDMRRLRAISDNVVHLPNGVTPLGAFTATGGDVLCLGRLARHKHVERVIAALAQPALAGVRLHVVGPQWDVSELALASLAERRGVADRVLLHGRVDNRRLAEIAKGCALFVSASSYEGFGMSAVESMSVGLIPVVQTNPAFVEIVETCKCGVLTDFSSPSVAAAAMRRQIDQVSEPQRRMAISAAAQYSWRGHAQRTLDLYTAALGVRAAA